MNWNTKAKTRAGRGRSRDDLENQQRLAAWNKLPKRKINGRAMITITENSDMLPLNAVTAQRNQFSDDMLMLGSKVSEYRTQDDHLLFEQTSSFKSPSKKEPSDDPLLLLEFTPEKNGRDGEAKMLNDIKVSFDIQNNSPQSPAASLKFFNNGHLCDERTGHPSTTKHTSATDHHDDEQHIHLKSSTIRKSQSYRYSSGIAPINALNVVHGLIKSKDASNFLGQSINHKQSNALREQDFTDKINFSPSEWWLRFLELLNDRVLPKNPQLMSFLSRDLDLSSIDGRCCDVRPKTALATLYRALNRPGLFDCPDISMNCSTKTLSPEESTALCNAIRYLELLEKQTIVRSETSSLSVDAAYDHERILAKNVYFDELSDSDFYSDEVSHPLQLSLNGSSEFKWNLFDGSIVYAAQHKGEVKAITCSETSNLHVGQIRWRAESDVHEESGKKRCVNKSFLARSHASGGFSLDNDNILIHEGNI